MANEDPASIPEQVRQNRPFFMVLGLAVLIAVCAFLYVLFSNPEANDVARQQAPAVAAPAAPATPAPAAPAATANAPAAPATN